MSPFELTKIIFETPLKWINVTRGDKKKNHFIAEVIQTGYKIGDPSNSSGQSRIIRPAGVNVYEYKK